MIKSAMLSLMLNAVWLVSLFGLAIVKETTACTSFYSSPCVHNLMRLDN